MLNTNSESHCKDIPRLQTEPRLLLILIVIGLLGNGVSYVTLKKMQVKDKGYKYLKDIAFTHFFLCVMFCVNPMFRDFCLLHNCEFVLTCSWRYFRNIIEPYGRSTLLIMVRYLMLLFITDRYIMINYPGRVSSWRQGWVFRWGYTISFLFSLAMVAPLSFLKFVVSNECPTNPYHCSIAYSSKNEGYGFIKEIFIFILPAIFLFTLSSMTVMKIRKFWNERNKVIGSVSNREYNDAQKKLPKKERARLAKSGAAGFSEAKKGEHNYSKRQRLMKAFSILLFCCVYVLTIIPIAIINGIFFFLVPDSGNGLRIVGNTENLILIFGNTLESMNYTLIFYFYYPVDTNFQEMVKQTKFVIFLKKQLTLLFQKCHDFILRFNEK